MKKPECRNCFFFAQGEQVGGTCHRYPPQVVVENAGAADGTTMTESVFPTVHPEAFCGEFIDAEEVEETADQETPA